MALTDLIDTVLEADVTATTPPACRVGYVHRRLVQRSSADIGELDWGCLPMTGGHQSEKNP
jgi:hypothetical protein